MSRRTALGGVLVAGWPVFQWYVARLQDGSDEPLGLLALALAIFFAPRTGWKEPISNQRLGALIFGLAILLIGAAGVPALGRALVVVTMIGVVAAPRGLTLGWTALLALALPVMATLQFYLGYPLRAATTVLSALLLRIGGLQVHASGTTLLWAGERVIVDAPCSGLQMAWSGALVAAAVACWLRLKPRDAFHLFRWTGVIVFVANLFRSMVLFLMGAGLWRLPDIAHEGIGLALFALAVGAIYLRATRYGTITEAAVSSGTA